MKYLRGEAQRRASPLKLTTSKSLRANESHKMENMRETKMSNLILWEGLRGLYIALQNGPLDKVKKNSLNESLLLV